MESCVGLCLLSLLCLSQVFSLKRAAVLEDGRFVEPSAHRHLVGLRVSSKASSRECPGNIVAEGMALTSGRCLKGAIDNIEVFLYNFPDSTAARKKSRPKTVLASGWHIHENFKTDPAQFDFGLVMFNHFSPLVVKEVCKSGGTKYDSKYTVYSPEEDKLGNLGLMEGLFYDAKPYSICKGSKDHEKSMICTVAAFGVNIDGEADLGTGLLAYDMEDDSENCLYALLSSTTADKQYALWNEMAGAAAEWVQWMMENQGGDYGDEYYF